MIQNLMFVVESHGKYVVVLKYEMTSKEVYDNGYDGEPLMDEDGNILDEDAIVERGVSCFVFNTKEEILLSGDDLVGNSIEQFNLVDGEDIGDVDDPDTEEDIIDLIRERV